MRLRVNLLESHSFAAITVEHAARSLIMNMDDLSLSHVGNVISLLLCPLRPCQIFQPCQRVIIWILLPQTSPYCRVGIIAECCLLPWPAYIGIPLMENLLLRKLRRFRRALFSVD